MGVAQSAISSGAFTPPEGMSIDHVSANIAAGYAISYVLSTVLIILFIKYLPSLFGIDPVKAGKEAEAEFSTGDDNEKLPSTFGFSDVGVLPIDVRAYKVTHQELVGRSVQELYQKFPDAAVLKVVRGEQVIDASDNPTLELNDVIGIRGEYRVLIAEGEAISEMKSMSHAQEMSTLKWLIFTLVNLSMQGKLSHNCMPKSALVFISKRYFDKATSNLYCHKLRSKWAMLCVLQAPNGA